MQQYGYMMSNGYNSWINAANMNDAANSILADMRDIMNKEHLAYMDVCFIDFSSDYTCMYRYKLPQNVSVDLISWSTKVKE